MALVTCPDCGKQHSDAAPACPECGRPQTPVMRKKQKPEGDRSTLWALLAIAGSIVAMALVILMESSDDTLTHLKRVASGDNASAAVAMCQKFVKRTLKAPATANFDNSENGVAPDGTAWMTSGAVDAENSFGAKIRTRFICRLQYDSAQRKWSLLDLRTW